MSLQPPVLLDRRKVVGGAALAVFGSALPLASTRAEDRYARFKGQTVSFSIPDHPHYDVMQKLLPQFTAETGIKVELVRDNILRMKHVQLAEMAKPQSSFDLVTYIVTWKGEYVKKNLIRPLEPLLGDARLADPAYAMGDLVPRYVQNIGLVGAPRAICRAPAPVCTGCPLVRKPPSWPTGAMCLKSTGWRRHAPTPSWRRCCSPCAKNPAWAR